MDLNRNYDYEWLATALRPGPLPFSEPETAAVRAQASVERPFAGLSLHSGAVNIGWPWNYTVANPAEAAALGAVAEIYAEACSAPAFWLTQGADWYVSNGDLNDWAYGRHGTFDFTVEVSLADEPESVTWHVGAILAFLAIAPAVEGTVVDADTGSPVEATVWVDGGQPFTSAAPTGRFATLESGRQLRVEAPGYLAAELPLGTEPVVVALARAGRTAGRLPDPVVWEVVDLGGPFTLVRPGAASVGVDGPLDPEPLDPGWYDVVWPSGSTWPRAVLVERALNATLTSWALEGDTLAVVGAGFDIGARAWVLSGDERLPVEVSVEVLGDDRLELDLSAAPWTSPADAVLWVNGSVLAIADLSVPGARVDPGPGCGCAGTVPVRWTSVWVAALIGAAARRKP